MAQRAPHSRLDGSRYRVALSGAAADQQLPGIRICRGVI